MTSVRVLFVVALMAVSSCILGQQTKNSDLEKVLWDVDQQWLCAGPYQKPYKDCLQFRSKYWVDQFFEIGSIGVVRNKGEMIAVQTAASPTQPYPADFKLIAVYGNFALATDHTDLKTVNTSGQLAFTSDSRALRLFVQENGEWRPAGAALVPVIPPNPPSTPVPPTSTKSPDEQLEKQLAAIDQKWLEATKTKKSDYLKELFTDQWFDIVGWDPMVTITKEAVLDAIGKLSNKPGNGVIADQFKLMAVYGDVALATDRRTRTWTDSNGRDVTTPHRSLLVFVKDDGQWRSAAAALVPIMVSQSQQ